jgi:hypothetical protein
MYEILCTPNPLCVVPTATAEIPAYTVRNTLNRPTNPNLTLQFANSPSRQDRARLASTPIGIAVSQTQTRGPLFGSSSCWVKNAGAKAQIFVRPIRPD